MTRGANPVDFWRGFALVTIFVNHIPGIFYEHFTHRNTPPRVEGILRMGSTLAAP